MAIYLGIDAGGTKTAALLVDGDGRELGRGLGGPCNVAQLTDEAVKLSLYGAMSNAFRSAGLATDKRLNGVCAGIAGYSVASRRDAFAGILQQHTGMSTCRVEPDYVVAWWGATHGEPGILVIAGTGAVAYGRNEQGQECREDGLGYLLGDRGSGFDLGLVSLRHTLKMLQEGTPDRMTEGVLAHTGARIQNEVLQWLYPQFNPARVASIAPIVGDLAENGDPAACYFVAQMARRLRHTVRTVRHRLWLPWDSPVYPLGGLWNLGAFFRSEFANPQWAGENGYSLPEDALAGGEFVIASPLSDAATGAALLARQ